ncbi:MAG: acyl-CoA dehydrogenase family protein [Burkholderiales bacterium]|nr:acyl-CoA dehydrogenase family protein [Burkholderiales bacterium]
MNAAVTTHEVFNQAEPLADVNLLRINRPLADALRVLAPGLETARLDALGAEVGSAAMQRHARLANEHGPVLHAHDLVGRRIDQVEFHPSYHALLGSALRHGLHGTPWAGGPLAHVERAAGFMLFTEAEPSVLCPVSMTYAVTPALRANAALQAEWGPRLAGREYDERFVPGSRKRAVTMGMGMTEKQGGSDVRANTTRATFDGEDGWGRRYRVTGHKWFMSAPMCDAFLVLAQAPGGLSCFFLPRWLPDGCGNGTVNTLFVQRLKHKLGNQANASSEVEFLKAAAWLVGEEGRGVPQILAMGALTRLDCALGTAGLMRQALSIALHHTAQRHAFGKPLVAQPLMKNVLADLALESEAATLLALRLALAVDRTETGGADAHEQVMRRVLTPVAKFWVCKRGSYFAQEAMECLGGNGYVEAAGEGVMARIYREMPVNSIWEGAGNIMALDLQRALRGADVAPALEHELRDARGAHAALDRAAARVLAAIGGGVPEAQSRILARDTALVLQAALLRRISPPAVFEAFCASRLAASSDVFGALDERADLDPIIERAIPVELA